VCGSPWGVFVIAFLLTLFGAGPSEREAAVQSPPDRTPRVQWRESRPVGSPSAGRLVRGVRLPAGGPGFVTWDPITREFPSRGWRRWGTDDVVRTTMRVLRSYARRHPDARPVVVGDLSRPRGGDFGPQYGFVGHASHQNGLDVDVYYPRRDGRLRPIRDPADVDRGAAQELVDAFVAAGAVKVFTGPSLGLRGPAGVVAPLAGHDNHLHVRFAPSTPPRSR
jgi:penicillin-insensitive murein endopeptidase